MKKLSKLIICLCLSIICFCGIVQNTYCGDLYSFSYCEREDLSNNFYNVNNSQYIKYNNLKISLSLTDNLYVMYYLGNLKDNVNLPLTVSQSFTSYGSDYSYFTVYYKLTLKKGKADTQYDVVLSDFNIGHNDWFLTFNEYRLSSLSQPIFTNVFSNCFSYVEYIGILGFFNYEFDISYSNQFYYNPIFGISYYMNSNFNYTKANYSVCFSNSNYSYTFNQSLSEYYNKYIQDDNYINYFRYLVLNRSSNYDNNYIDHISIKFNSGWGGEFYANIDDLSYFENVFYCNLNSLVVDGANSINSFIYSSNVVDSGSSLIPLGSNSYYKQCEWYDIPAHLYNFFIYIIFDAPIISNFTKLAMVIINFLVEAFNFVIGLFSGIENAFFISIFVGMFALIFLLKIIFGGKT